MNPLVYVSVGLYFEISDAEMFGGEGTVGYTAVNLEGVKNLTKITDEYVEAQTQATANFFKVSRNAVKLISKEVYDKATEEDDELNED